MRGESTRTRGGWQRAIAVVGVAVLVTLVGCLGGGGNSTAEDTVETPWGATETTPEPTTADVSGIDGSVRKCKSMDMSNHSVYSTTDHAGVRGSVEYTEDSTLMSVTIKVKMLDGSTVLDEGEVERDGPIRQGRTLRYDLQFAPGVVENATSYEVSVEGGSFLAC